MLSFLKWDEREAYEKAIMMALGAAIVLALLWFLAVNPVLSSKAEAQTQSEKALRDYNIVSNALPQLNSGPTSAIGQPFSRAVLISAARTKNVKLTRVQPDGQTINVWIDDVDTRKLYSLINALITENGADLSRATITTSDSGLLSAQLTLQ